MREYMDCVRIAIENTDADMRVAFLVKNDDRDLMKNGTERVNEYILAQEAPPAKANRAWHGGISSNGLDTETMSEW